MACSAIIFSSSLKPFYHGPSCMPISQSISLIFLQGVEGGWGKDEFWFAPVDSSFQSNLTESKLDENKTNTQTCLPHLPTLGDFIVQLEKALKSPPKVDLLHRQTRSGTPAMSQCGRKRAINAQLSMAGVNPDIRKIFGLKVSPNHSLPQRLGKKAKICLGVWWKTSILW